MPVASYCSLAAGLTFSPSRLLPPAAYRLTVSSLTRSIHSYKRTNHSYLPAGRTQRRLFTPTFRTRSRPCARCPPSPLPPTEKSPNRSAPQCKTTLAPRYPISPIHLSAETHARMPFSWSLRACVFSTNGRACPLARQLSCVRFCRDARAVSIVVCVTV